MNSTQRLAVVVSHPTQYYAPWFRTLAETPEIELKVFYLWKFGFEEQMDPQFGVTIKWDIDLQSGYDWEFVPNVSKRPGTSTFSGLNNPTLKSQLKRWKPQAVLVFGYGWRTMLELVFGHRKYALILRGDTHSIGRQKHSNWRERTRRAVLRQLFNQYDAFACVGSNNQKFYTNHGVSISKCFSVPHCVDNARFAIVPPTEVQTWRDEQGIDPNQKIFLFAGKFEPKKRPDLLIHAFASANLKDVLLLMVGNGEMQSQLEEITETTRANVRFLPFQNQSQMPVLLHGADVVVLPSEGPNETWGLIVNEAMACGTPAIVSSHVGCALDLVLPDETGWIFEAGSLDQLKLALLKANARIAADSDTFATATRKHIADYSYATATQGLIDLLAAVVPNRADSNCNEAAR